MIKFVAGKPVMKSLQKSFKEAALAVIAAENGIISPNKLVHILSNWVDEPGSSIIEKLKEALPPESVDLLELINYHAEENDDNVNDSYDILIESVQRIKEKTKLSIVPSASGDNNESHRLVTEESPGRYVVQNEIARGGAGRVLLALDRHLGREVAMKELLLDLRDQRDGEKREDPHSKSLRNRFLREARVTGQLEHPSIVPVYEIGQHSDGNFYYTMRMVKGRTLSKVIKECHPLSDRMELLPHFYNICNAVAYAHSKGVINRDLKPSNVMIGEFGETVVLDWGLAKVKGQHDAGADKIQSGMRLIMNADVGRTVVGFAIGTPSYMPPEQAEGNVDEIDETSDIYSLGAILYQLLTGNPPYKGKTASEILRKVVLAELTPVCEQEPEAPPELAAIAEKALSKNKIERYQSTTELIDELNSYMSGGKVSGYRYSFFELIKKFTSRNKAAFISSVMIFLVLIASTLLITWYYRREVKAKQSAQNEKTISQFRAAQAFNETAVRLEFEKRFLSSRVYAAASMLYNPANANSLNYDPDHEEKFPSASALLTESLSRFYQRHFHRGAVFEKGIQAGCRITASAVTADTSLIVAGCENGEVVVFDSKDMKKRFRRQTGSGITNATLSNDGKTALFSSASGNISSLDISTGEIKIIHKIPGGSDCLKFRDGDRSILSCGGDGTLRFFSFPGMDLYEIKGGLSQIKDGYVFEKERTVIYGGDNKIIKLDLDNPAAKRSITIDDQFISGIAVSSDQRYAVAGTESGTIHIINIDSMTIVRSIKHHPGAITSLSFSSDGSMFLSSDLQRKIIVWDFSNGEPLFSVEGHENTITDTFFDKTGDYIFSAGLDGFIRLWKLHGRKGTLSFETEGSFINGAVFAGETAGIISRTNKVEFFNKSDGSEHSVFKDHSGPIYDLAVSSDGLKGAVAGWNTEITVFTIPDLKTVAKLKGNKNAVTDISFSNDGKYLISGGRDGSVRLFSLNDLSQKALWKCGEGVVKKLDMSPDGKHVATVCGNNRAVLLSIPGLDDEKNLLKDKVTVNTIVFTPCGKNVIAGSDKELLLINIDGSGQTTLSGHSHLATLIVFSEDGKYFASSGRDNSVKIWDYEKLMPLLSLNTDREPGCLVFTPENNGLMVCEGNRARVWPLEFIDPDKNPMELLKEMEKDAGMKLKDFYLEPWI